MITTVTLNASVDRRYVLHNFEKGGTFRVTDYQATAGGKGLNVARVIRILGEEVTATGFLGGSSGLMIGRELDKLGLRHNFVTINGETRNCLAILAGDGSQTEILEPGPEIFSAELDEFRNRFDTLVDQSSVLVISGSVPQGVPSDIYRDLVQKAKQCHKLVILDTSGEHFRRGIEASPNVIKPNKEELAAFAKRASLSDSDMLEQAHWLSRQGIDYVVISLGSDGAIAVCQGDAYKIKIPLIKAVNPVGSGDAMIAGMAVGLHKGFSTPQLLAYATACGTANALEAETGVVRLDEVNQLKSMIQVDRV